jgi:hypothetical protein
MTIFRNTVAVVSGLVLGSAVNMGLIMIGSGVVPPPTGVDPTSPDSIAASAHLFEAKHFVFPFLAHALGTLAGALVASLIATSWRARLALVIGALFLLGGIANAFMIPAPAWFLVLDLVVAYLPAAWLGSIIGLRLRAESQ